MITKPKKREREKKKRKKKKKKKRKRRGEAAREAHSSFETTPFSVIFFKRFRLIGKTFFNFLAF